MKCKHCGAELVENAVFCGSCGAKIDIDSSKKTKSSEGSVPEHEEYKTIHSDDSSTEHDNNTENDRKSVFVIKRKYFIIGITVFFVIIIGGITGFELYKNNISKNIPADSFQENNNQIGADSYVTTTSPQTTETTSPQTQATTQTQTNSQSTSNNSYVVIADGGLRIRDNPDKDSGKQIGLIPNGTEIIPTEFRNGWAYITYRGVSGWCSGDFIYESIDYDGEPQYSAVVKPGKGATLTTDIVVNSVTIETRIPAGTVVYVYMTSGDRSYVRYNNIYGWCQNSYLN